ncbi:MAG TPA: Holliday junction branch migration protein RuvA [Syntrophales bacterium]|nr:Holliday junction branch migration protein RuvA [Syntrophales bacterium]HOM07946.1 Holliday junction branch migration protein RuvA [Syntrophales bacterium]HOO00656.1 Holliday junction branch migration protein RuvA [Syntrophales bacterium]HPC01910.1 Holliday junction branch migration protein RuvA [Syntrophales bacterium]HRS87806.1 Holliday junction branch migration protein RuvA [Syntrophales bacterium]
MIARICGTLTHKSVSHLVVDVNGVGYRVFVPLSTFYELPETGQVVTLHVHTHVKEDGINLFGFLRQEEREIFQVMISASGIGPRLAMNILSGVTAADFVAAVTRGDLGRLTRIPGVGRKTGERIILELKDKIHKIMPPEGRGEAREAGPTKDDLIEDALSALTNLGYKSGPARIAVDETLASLEGIPTLDLLLKGALRRLAG